MKITQLHQLFQQYPTVSTDTRSIERDSIFFALKGERFNGNKFAGEALTKGAAYAVVDEAEYVSDDRIILVSDVLSSLQELATFHRMQNNAEIIALTGSNGKTTTKELLYAVLSKRYKSIATKGNLNNHIGVPLTLLRIRKETELAIIEMGANHIGEIAALCKIAKPNYGYITNFGKAHLEGFGSEEGVILGKSELYQYLIENGGHIFINADDETQRHLTSSYIKKYGYSTEDPQYSIIRYGGANPFVRLSVDGVDIQTQLIGKYNFQNCAAAFLIGRYFNVSLQEAKEAIESYIPKNNRSQIIEIKGRTIVLDAYNANPSSVEAALESLSSMRGPCKVAVLGDMLELGESSLEEHQAMAEMALSKGFDKVFLFGGEFARTTVDVPKFVDYKALAAKLKDDLPDKATILIKGSRGMALERLIDNIN